MSGISSLSDFIEVLFSQMYIAAALKPARAASLRQAQPMDEMMRIDNINQKVGSTELRNSMNTFLLLKAALLIPSST